MESGKKAKKSSALTEFTTKPVKSTRQQHAIPETAKILAIWHQVVE